MFQRTFLLIIVFPVALSLHAQGTLFDVLDATKSNNAVLLSKNGKPVEGNPNLFEGYRTARIYGKSENSASGQINVDLYHQKLLIKVEDAEYTANPSHIKKVSIQYTPDSVAEFRYVNSSFMQILYEDSTCAVYIHYSVKIRKGTPGNGYTEAKNDSFEQVQSYQLMLPFALSFSDSKDLIKKLSKLEGTKEKISGLGKLKGDDKNRIIQIVKNL